MNVNSYLEKANDELKPIWDIYTDLITLGAISTIAESLKNDDVRKSVREFLDNWGKILREAKA